MFHDAFAKLSDRAGGFSGQRAFDIVADLVRHHRIQASPGYRAAANHCAALLAEAGLDPEILRFPANFAARSWHNGHFQEWDCRGATLRLVSPAGEARGLADYAESKLAIVQRSAATPPGGITAPIVLLEPGAGEEESAGRDVRGALVFSGGAVARVDALAVAEYGALDSIT